MNQIADLAAILAISQLVFVGVYFLTHYQGLLARLISLYSFCLSAYVLAGLPLISGNLFSFFLLFRFATLAPFILWVIAFTLFVDNEKIHPATWFVILYFELTRGVGIGISYIYPALTINDFGFVVVQIIPQGIMLLFALHTIYLAYHGYGPDLLEQRRRLRLSFVVIMGVLLIVVVGSGFINLFSRFFLEENQTILPFVPDYLISLYIFVMTFLFCQRIFQLNQEATTLITGGNKSTDKTRLNGNSQNKVDPSFLEKIKQTMEEGKLYTQTGLTISDLADNLSIQEYRLRRIINQQLNFRNFNQFLNNYRIEDACNRLKETNTPVSTIALDVGYASLSVFNKAFKERYGVTPTEFRNS